MSIVASYVGRDNSAKGLEFWHEISESLKEPHTIPHVKLSGISVLPVEQLATHVVFSIIAAVSRRCTFLQSNTARGASFQ